MTMYIQFCAYYCVLFSRRVTVGIRVRIRLISVWLVSRYVRVFPTTFRFFAPSPCASNSCYESQSQSSVSWSTVDRVDIKRQSVNIQSAWNASWRCCHFAHLLITWRQTAPLSPSMTSLRAMDGSLRRPQTRLFICGCAARRLIGPPTASDVAPAAPTCRVRNKRQLYARGRVISRETRGNAVQVFKNSTNALYAGFCVNDFKHFPGVISLIGPEPMQKRPGAWTQAPISAWLASVPIVSVLRNDHWFGGPRCTKSVDHKHVGET